MGGITAPKTTEITKIEAILTIILIIVGIILSILLLRIILKSFLKILTRKKEENINENKKDSTVKTIITLGIIFIIATLVFFCVHNHKNEKDENTEKTEETIKNEIIRTRKATINDVEFENKQGFSTTTITITAKENIKNLKIEVTLLDKNRKNLVKYDRTAGNLQKGETKEIELSLELLSFLDRYKIEYVYYEVTEGTVEY